MSESLPSISYKTNFLWSSRVDWKSPSRVPMQSAGVPRPKLLMQSQRPWLNLSGEARLDLDGVVARDELQ